MLISKQRITESILDTLARIQRRSDVPQDVIYDLSVAATTLRHTQHVDISNGEDMRGYGKQAVELLQAMTRSELITAVAKPKINPVLNTLIEAAKKIAASTLQGDALKQSFTAFLALLDQKLGEIAGIAPTIATPLLSSFAAQLLKQHNSLDLFGKPSENIAAEVSPGEPLTEANLTAYLQHKLSDPTAAAKKVVTLSGGFGKETSLFTVTSKTLNADLVMRRDSPIDAFGGMDCHIAPREYPLLKAVHARGFPAPEPIFFEADSQEIKGPAFTIMRRAAGAVAGDATGGQGKVPAELQRKLAQVTARLHSVAPLTELADIPAFEPSLWKKSASECTRSYLESWYRHFRQTDHLPTPALHGLFNWLLAHVPAADEASTLIHGDIGFHNLLFNDGQLSAVLDWEFSHVGDPAEDIGYIRSVMGGQLDWARFIADYGNAGRPIPSEERVRFFEIWSHVRNAAGSVTISNHFEAGRFRNIKYGMIIYRFVPHFIAQAEALIANYDKR